MPQAIVATHRSNGGRLVSVDGRELPLRNAAVSGEARGGLARVTLKQTFSNPHPEPMKVTYMMPLPADGAVAGYEFRIGPRRVVGEIDARGRARERFEQALIEGRTAGILDQERANLFTQEIGNVPPGTEVAVELTIDQPLLWLPEGMWEWRFPTVAPPRYLGVEGRVPDAPDVTVEVADRPLAAVVSLDLVIGDALTDGRRPESPSHGLSVGSRMPTRVTLAGDSRAALDRDLVVRWPVPRPRPGITLQVARPEARFPHAAHAYGLLTIVPPETPAAVYPRDLIVLLDTSGSMTGAPLDQARRVVAALVDSLTDSDRLEIISFASRPRPWRKGPVPATAEMRREALRFLDVLQAGGGTEMLDAVEEALEPLRRDAQRQVVLVTDGQIGFESEILRAMRRGLPSGSRLHAVGVGSAPNRALTRPAARAGRGVEVLAALREDAERAAARLVAATRGPAIIDLEIQGPGVVTSAPRALPDLMAGSPVRVGLSLLPGGGELIVRGRTPGGLWEEQLRVPPTEPGAGSPCVTALYGREAVEDLELDLAAGGDPAEIDRAIERVGLEFAVATRLTSWVAISEEPTVDPRLPVRREIIPQELPHGMSAEGLGLGALPQASMLLDSINRSHSIEVAAAAYFPSFSLERMREFLREAASLRGRGPDTPEGETAPAQPAPAARAVPGRWVGALQAGGRILEFQVTGAPLDWRPAARATIGLRDGKRIEIPVIPTATTLPGPVEPGLLVHLALRVGTLALKDVAWVEVDCGDTLVRIDLSESISDGS